MMKFPVLILVFLLSHFASSAQHKNNKIKFSFGIGLDKSIGKDKTEHADGIINPNVTIGYYSHKKYNKPGFRLRTDVSYNLKKDISLAFVTGVTLHTKENYYGANFSYITVPVQLAVRQTVVSVKRLQIEVNAAGGWNLFKIYEEFLTEKTGSLFSVGTRMKLSEKYFMRIGYENQLDNGFRKIPTDPSIGTQEETIRYKQKREQIYIEFGLQL